MRRRGGRQGAEAQARGAARDAELGLGGAAREAGARACSRRRRGSVRALPSAPPRRPPAPGLGAHCAVPALSTTGPAAQQTLWDRQAVGQARRQWRSVTACSHPRVLAMVLCLMPRVRLLPVVRKAPCADRRLPAAGLGAHRTASALPLLYSLYACMGRAQATSEAGTHKS